MSFKRARAQNRPTPDSTKPAVGRVIHRIKGAVDSLARERSSRAVLELDTAHTFAHLSAQIAGLQTAFTTLADGVIDELDAQREEHARWRRESDRWVGKMAHLESEIWKRCDVVDDALDEKNAVSRATFDKLRDEMGHAERAVDGGEDGAHRRGAKGGGDGARDGVVARESRGRGFAVAGSGAIVVFHPPLGFNI